ncbi:MAG: transcription termination/antitermination protein NusG [bacterium]
MSEKAWYIISTQGIGSRAVLKIQAILDVLGYEGMLWTPMIKIPPTTTTKKVKINGTILFPSYVFIQAVIDDSKLEQALMEAKFGKFLKLPGSTLPSQIEEICIEHIKKLEESNVEPVPEEIISIELGNLVEICVGPLIGFKGIVVKISGHSASIDTLIFGRSTPVSVNIAHLSKLTENNPNEEKAN